MSYEDELNNVLPRDLPERAIVVAKAGEHLRLIEERNKLFNLTRITSPREAAIKHVVDSVAPWRLFADARHVLDAGTGAGFPGIPLALVLPGTQFTLADSTQKKARFVTDSVAALQLKNVTVEAKRVEEMRGPWLITARALAPVSRAIGYFAPAVQAGAKVLLYKGPDAEHEMAEASSEAQRKRVRLSLAARYSLPDGLGMRTIVQIAS